MVAFKLKQYLKPGDAVIGVVWLVLFIGSMLSFRVGRQPGTTARIIDGNGVTRIVSLHENQSGTISGPAGITRFQVESGAIRITEAPCPHKHCMHLGRIHRSGEALICVPNRIVIEVEGNAQNAVDAVTM